MSNNNNNPNSKSNKPQAKPQGRPQDTPSGGSKKGSIQNSQKSQKTGDSPTKREMVDTQYSQNSYATYTETGNDDGVGGESVKVALRIRPMNSMEFSRGDEYCIKVINDKACQIKNK